jgi:hypothetical protein
MAASNALAPLLDMQPGRRRTNSDEDGERGEQAWMPGLPTLRAQQRDLIQSLRSGFQNRRHALMWAHAVGVLSLGHVSDEWYAELLGDRYRVGALLADTEDRADLCSHPPSDSSATFIRDQIQQDALAPAFQDARAEIRASASDYTEGEGGVGDPSRQRFLAMRPRLHQIAVAQHQALLEAFDDFESRREVLDWADFLDYATLSYLPGDFPSRVSSPTSDWWHVLTSSERGVWLELRLAETVLPAANNALRDAMQSGTEEPSTISDLEVPSG